MEPGITLFLAGDVMPGRGIDQILPSPCPPLLYERYMRSALGYVQLAERAYGPIARPAGFDYVWGDALAVLDGVAPAARIINLETSITTSESAEHKGINYRMHPANAGVITAAGIDCCVLANNHVLDWGEAGLLETLAVLAAAGVQVAGAGRTEAAAHLPAMLDTGGGRVLVFAFAATDSGVPAEWTARADAPGIAVLPDFSATTVARIANAVGAVKRAGDVAIASLHWGGNWEYAIPVQHRRFAHGLIDGAGIDIVYGHSSHHPKGIEVYRDRLILYGCGDFIDDYEGIGGYESFRADLVLMYCVKVDAATGRLAALDMTPFRIRNFRLRHCPEPDRAWLQQRLDRECRHLGTRVTRHAAGLALTW